MIQCVSVTEEKTKREQTNGVQKTEVRSSKSELLN